MSIAFDGESGSYKDAAIAAGSYSSSALFDITEAGLFDASFSAYVKGFTNPVAFITNTATNAVYNIALAPSSTGRQYVGDLETQLSSGIYSLTVKGTVPTGTTGAYSGNLQFTPSAVPEPAAWAMMIAGVGFAGSAMRRRARKTTVRFA